MPCTLESVKEAACQSGIGKLDNRIELLKTAAQLSCEIADSSVTNAIVESFVARSGISSQSQIDAITALVQAARDNGWWDKCDLIYPFVGGTAGTHAQNLKSSSFTITWNGTVTHDANGITGNGTTGYGDPAYIPSAAPLWSLNSAHISFYRRVSGTDSRYYFAATQTGKSSGMIAKAPFTNFGAAINDGTPLTSTSFSPIGLGFAVCNRVNSTQTSVNGITVAQNSTGVATGGLFILARNTIGIGPQNFSNANLASATAGAGLTDSERTFMASDWQTFQTALGRQV